MTKAQAIESFKTQQTIQMDSMDEMMKEGMGNVYNQEDQMRMMTKMMVKQAKSQDLFAQKSGFEEDELQKAIVELDL